MLIPKRILCRYEIKIMKTILILISFTSYLFSYNIDSLGINNDKTLNSDEYEYIRDLLKSREILNDSLKIDNKYVFITGGSGRKILLKKEYFKNYVIPWIKKEQMPAVGIIYLTEEERKMSGGYDAILYIWVKIFSDSSRRYIINKLKKKR